MEKDFVGLWVPKEFDCNKFIENNYWERLFNTNNKDELFDKEKERFKRFSIGQKVFLYQAVDDVNLGIVSQGIRQKKFI